MNRALPDNRMWKRWVQAGRVLLDLVYSRACHICGGALTADEWYMCWNCRTSLTPVQSPYCDKCGDPIAGVVDVTYECYQCTRCRPYFDRARSAIRYCGPARLLVRDFKYHHALWLAREFVRLMEPCLRVDLSSERFDIVTCVPMYPARMRSRSYNQSQLLAVQLARRLRLPVMSDTLERVRDTPTQTHLSAHERAENVRGAFEPSCAQRYANKKMLIVDDVMTTGATINECARMLKKGGAAGVWALTLARG